MNRLVFVALVSIALAGCAQTQSGQPQTGSPFPPVGLEPLPSIHETINAGLKPSQPGRSTDRQLAATDADTATEVATAAESPAAGRRAPYADRLPSTARPRSRAAADSATAPAEAELAATEVASAAKVESAPAAAEPAPPASADPAPAPAATEVAEAKPAGVESMPAPEPAEPAAVAATASPAPSTEPQPAEPAAGPASAAAPATEPQPVAAASAPTTAIPLELLPAPTAEPASSAPATAAKTDPTRGAPADAAPQLELPPAQQPEPPASAKIEDAAAKTEAPAAKTEAPAVKPDVAVTEAPATKTEAPPEPAAAPAEPAAAPAAKTEAPAVETGPKTEPPAAKTEPPAASPPQATPTIGDEPRVVTGRRPRIFRPGQPDGAPGPISEAVPAQRSNPVVAQPTPLVSGTARILKVAPAAAAQASAGSANPPSGGPPPVLAGRPPIDNGPPPSAQLPFDPPPLPDEPQGSSAPSAELPPLPPDAPTAERTAPPGAQPGASASTDLPPLPDSKSGLPPLPDSTAPSTSPAAQLGLPPLPGEPADSAAPAAGPAPAGALPPLPPGASNAQGPPPAEISLAATTSPLPAPADGAPAAPAPVVPAPVPPTQLDPAVRRTSDESAIRTEIKPRTADEYTEIAARVGDEVITLQELRKAYQEWVRSHVPAGQRLSPQERDQVVRLVLNNLIDRTLAIQEAHRGIKNAKQWDKFKEFALQSWAEEELQPLLRKYGVKNEYELRQKLTEQGKSLDEMRQDYQLTKMAREFVMMKVRPKLNVGLPEMREYYNEHLSDFNRPATITWRELVVEVNKNPDRATARRKADTLLARVRNGEDFAALAKAQSDGPTAREGGLWKTTPGSYAVPAVNESLASTALHQISPVLEGPSSFHIIRVEDRRAAGPARFDEAQDEIHEILTERVFQREMKAFVDHLRERTLITTKMDQAETP